MSFRTANDKIIDLVDLTTTDEFSEIVDCTNIYGLSVHAVSTGTISGTVRIQVSNNKTDWVALSSPTITITDATNAAVSLADMFYKWVRIQYDATSGTTNTLKVWFNSKGI